MAIAFNLPSEREAAEENFSRLNRLLAELYEVLCHILVSRQPGQEAQENRRERGAYSESDLPQPTTQTQHCRRSASSPPLTLTFDSDLEDDVFAPRSDRTNDIFSTRNLDIFGYGTPRTPAGALLSPRRERTFTFSVTSEKHWRDKGGTDVADGIDDADGESIDETDAPSEKGRKMKALYSRQSFLLSCPVQFVLQFCSCWAGSCSRTNGEQLKCRVL